MKDLTNKDKLSLIKKYYQKKPLLLELSFNNYEGYNLYICINELKKDKDYRLSWFDLDDIKDKDIEKHLSCEHISGDAIKEIKKYYSEFESDIFYHDDSDKDLVILNTTIKTKSNTNINISFNRYLPSHLACLIKIFGLVFGNMPDKYSLFINISLAKIFGKTEKYEYKKEFDFDLFNDDIDKIFKYHIVERGKKYYEESKVKFLEKVEDKYCAIVEGNEKYVTIVSYDKEKKKTQVYCSCPCEFYCKHMYAVILAIRNNKYNNFYKISYNDPTKSLLDKVTNFSYLLCVGIYEDYFEIINNYGEIELVPILLNNEYNWEILEDKKEKSLKAQVEEYLEGKEEYL